MATGKPPAPSAAALDVIFSCQICQATISDIYRRSAGNSGFRDGRPDTSDTRVTSLWLTSCMHLTCGSHLEGGGAPFHPEGARPEAACPVCVKEAHDDRLKTLYAVRGWKEGAYDEDIPEDLFVAPPVELDGKSIKMQALQFQYTSLLRYGTAKFDQRRTAEKARSEAEQRASEAEKRHREVSDQVMVLKSRVAAMEKDQAEVSKWKARMPQITHYLKLCPELIGEIDQLREQLRQLGYAVPRRDYSMEIKSGPKPRTHSRAEKPPKQPETLDRSSSSGKKRKHDDYIERVSVPAPQFYSKSPAHKENPQSSIFRAEKQQAPMTENPPRALQNGLSARQDDGLNRYLAPPSRAEVYTNGQWRDNSAFNDRHAPSIPADRLHDTYHAQSNMMSGALPASPATVARPRDDQTVQSGDSQRPLAPYNLERDDTVMSTAQYAQPIEVQPMEDYVREQDSQYVKNNGYHVHDRVRPDATLTIPYLLNSSNRIPLGGAHSRLGPSRQLPVRAPTRGNFAQPCDYGQTQRTNPQHQFARPRETIQDPITPAPKRLSVPKSTQRINSVASPFFKTGSGAGNRHSGLTASMTGLSAHARIGSSIARRAPPPPPPPLQGWHEPRSLNGLSFIHEPRDAANEPLLRSSRARPSVNPFLSISAAAPRTEAGLFRRPGEIGGGGNGGATPLPPPSSLFHRQLDSVVRQGGGGGMPPPSAFAQRGYGHGLGYGQAHGHWHVETQSAVAGYQGRRPLTRAAAGAGTGAGARGFIGDVLPLTAVEGQGLVSAARGVGR